MRYRKDQSNGGSGSGVGYLPSQSGYMLTNVRTFSRLKKRVSRCRVESVGTSRSKQLAEWRAVMPFYFHVSVITTQRKSVNELLTETVHCAGQRWSGNIIISARCIHLDVFYQSSSPGDISCDVRTWALLCQEACWHRICEFPRDSSIFTRAVESCYSHAFLPVNRSCSQCPYQAAACRACPSRVFVMQFHRGRA